jgi:hypothetical protein
MSDEARRRAPMPDLSAIIERYATLADKFGDPVALSAFELSPELTQALFSSLDEDYHISRHLHFSNGGGNAYLISGAAATLVSIDAAIREVL